MPFRTDVLLRSRCIVVQGGAAVPGGHGAAAHGDQGRGQGGAPVHQLDGRHSDPLPDSAAPQEVAQSIYPPLR